MSDTEKLNEAADGGLLQPRLVVPLPDHHARYARAWGIYQSDDLSLENYETLEAEMDAAQNLFSWEEFQEFKLTLDGFEEAWAGWRREFLSHHNTPDHPPLERSDASDCSKPTNTKQ